jgi:hypothetical protein
VRLDLGFQGDFAFPCSILDTIQNKKYRRLKTVHGIRGIGYQNRVYETPEVRVNSIGFTHPELYELSAAFIEDSIILKKDNISYTARDLGLIGWNLFRTRNLFLDIDSSLIVFSDSLETIRQNGYVEMHFAKVPLILDNGCIEVQAQGPTGALRCLLDTGASMSVMHTESKKEQTLEQALQDPENISRDNSLMIGETSFGPIVFFHLPIHLPGKIEAILGMDFFREHMVFIDFSEKYVYIAQKASKI